MQSENKMFDDFVKMVNGFAGTFAGMGREAESSAREKFKEWMGGADFVGRDEFEAVKAMAAAARDENESLESAHCGAGGKARSSLPPQSDQAQESKPGGVNLSEEEIQDERDDGAPIEVLEQYFEARGWACERTAEGEIVASATGSWAQYELRGVWRPEDQVLQFLAFPDIKVAADKRTAIYESLSLMNEQLWLGHFEMWSGSGLVVFRHSTILDADDEVSVSNKPRRSLRPRSRSASASTRSFSSSFGAAKRQSEAIAAALIDTHGEA